MKVLTLAADHIELRRLGPWLAAVTDDIDANQLGRIELCIHELASNVIDHSGATELQIEVDTTAGRLRAEIRDAGDPLAMTSGDLDPHPRVRGYGMMIAEHLATAIDYERRAELNVWTASFDLAPTIR